MVTIVQEPHPVLRQHARAVERHEFGSVALKKIITAMQSALSRERFGVAIAAPQIGESLRIFVVSGHVYALQKEEDPNEHTYPDGVYINPRILSASRKHSLMHEGCLSVPGKTAGTMQWGNVRRAEKVRIEAYTLDGTKQTVGASGLLAQVFQHEIDHLDGVLYTDKAAELYEEQLES